RLLFLRLLVARAGRRSPQVDCHRLHRWHDALAASDVAKRRSAERQRERLAKVDVAGNLRVRAAATDVNQHGGWGLGEQGGVLGLMPGERDVAVQRQVRIAGLVGARLAVAALVPAQEQRLQKRWPGEVEIEARQPELVLLVAKRAQPERTGAVDI